MTGVTCHTVVHKTWQSTADADSITPEPTTNPQPNKWDTTQLGHSSATSIAFMQDYSALAANKT